MGFLSNLFGTSRNDRIRHAKEDAIRVIHIIEHESISLFDHAGVFKNALNDEDVLISIAGMVFALCTNRGVKDPNDCLEVLFSALEKTFDSHEAFQDAREVVVRRLKNPDTRTQTLFRAGRADAAILEGAPVQYSIIYTYIMEERDLLKTRPFHTR